jgi:hypothetical protein
MMGRPGLTSHKKFRRLAQVLGSAALARGHLELLWETTYENGDEYLGDITDVELSAHWSGEPGKLTEALLAAGGDGDAGFIEEIPDRPGKYRVHDLWDHAPDYVRKRRTREYERRTKGAELASLTRQRPVSDRSDQSVTGQRPVKTHPLQDEVTGQCPPNGRTPAPAPAPAPIEITETSPQRSDHSASAPKTEPTALESEPTPAAEEGKTAAPPAAAPSSAPKKKANGTDPRFAPLRAVFEQEFLAATKGVYRWQGAKDAKALHALIAVPPEEFRAKARAGLSGIGYTRAATVSQLAAKWNDITAANGPAPPRKLVFEPAAASSEFTGGVREI